MGVLVIQRVAQIAHRKSEYLVPRMELVAAHSLADWEVLMTARTLYMGLLAVGGLAMLEYLSDWDTVAAQGLKGHRELGVHADTEPLRELAAKKSNLQLPSSLG